MSNSPWASTIVMLKTKDRSHQFCIDYKALNNLITNNTYSLHSISAILELFNDAQWFYSLDLKEGYWQFLLKEGDKPKMYHHSFSSTNLKSSRLDSAMPPKPSLGSWSSHYMVGHRKPASPIKIMCSYFAISWSQMTKRLEQSSPASNKPVYN